MPGPRIDGESVEEQVNRAAHKTARQRVKRLFVLVGSYA